jgi:hypothetical protein
MAVTTSEKVPDESLHGLGYEPDAGVAMRTMPSTSP